MMSKKIKDQNGVLDNFPIRNYSLTILPLSLRKFYNRITTRNGQGCRYLENPPPIPWLRAHPI